MARLIPVVLLAAAAAADADAQAFKCTVNGKAVYQEKPCEGGTEIPIRAEPSASPLDMLAARGRISPGMTAAQVRHAYGPPTSVNPSYTGGRYREQWVYRSQYATQYVYFEDGICTGWN